MMLFINLKLQLTLTVAMISQSVTFGALYPLWVNNAAHRSCSQFHGQDISQLPNTSE